MKKKYVLLSIVSMIVSTTLPALADIGKAQKLVLSALGGVGRIDGNGCVVFVDSADGEVTVQISNGRQKFNFGLFSGGTQISKVSNNRDGLSISARTGLVDNSLDVFRNEQGQVNEVWIFMNGSFLKCTGLK